MPEQQISAEELAYRKRCLTDFRRFEPNIPDHLKDRLNEALAEDGRSALLEVLILAVQAGRMIQLEDSNHENARLLIDKVEAQIKKQSLKHQATLSPLAKSLIDSQGRELKKETGIETIPEKIVDIMTVPAGIISTSTKH